MKKLIRLFLVSIVLLSSVYGQEYKKQFIKGNISDKTAAVREASGQEGIWLSQKAIEFVLENNSIIGTDRDMDGLAVAAVLSLPNDYVAGLSEIDKNAIMDKFIALFDEFSRSNTVQIAVQSKVLSLKDILNTQPFTDVLNKFLQSPMVTTSDSSLLKSVINSLGFIGNNISFSILYNDLNDKRYAAYSSDIENTITKLIPVSMNEVLQIVVSKDAANTQRIFNLVTKATNISTNNLCEIAENVLIEAPLTSLQFEALSILNAHKWTRASNSVLAFFADSQKNFQNGLITEEQFVELINSLVNLSPLDAVTPLIKYLGELNSQLEYTNSVSQNVVLAVINSLGAIGDKSAFDALLSVTYLNYPEPVLSAARQALAGLRW
ncbi:MAG: HEAT repeat domain-containing protein [Treponema sp.]|nr:HEAT repeat domain-containing protein [Treponema sp.]